MTVYNLGSINIDHFYAVPHLPAPGETLAAHGYATGLGGKGANQSVAAALAGSRTVHIGAVGPDGAAMVDRMQRLGVECSHVAQVETATAHAIINVDDHGENAIVIFSGANLKQSLTRLERAFSDAGEGDYLLLQNETDLQAQAAELARFRGLFVIYSAAPFSADAVRAVLPHVDLLVMNDVEASQLAADMGTDVNDLPVPHVLITQGAQGATWRDLRRGHDLHVPAFAVTPVDTTGAGDCFIGTTAAGMDQGLCAQEAMRLGSAASAIQITRHGTADAIPTRAEVDRFLNAQRG